MAETPLDDMAPGSPGRPHGGSESSLGSPRPPP